MESVATIAVLNWNGERHVHRCLEHVFAQSHPAVDVIVIDNGSSDGSMTRIQKRYGSRCRYIQNPTNTGYSHGMNQGICAAKGEFVLPLNQDACLHRDFVAECVKRMAQDATIGAIGGRVFSWVGDELTGELLLRKGDGERKFLRKRFQGCGCGRAESDAWVFGPAGCYPFLRRRMLEDVRGVTGDYFDECFVTGWEDVDLWFRMQLRGWKCLFVPAAYGWHVGSGSVGGKTGFFDKSLNYRARILRNRLFTMTKNLPPRVLLSLAPYLILTELGMVPYFLFRSPSSILAFVSAWFGFVTNCRTILRKRRRIQEGATVEGDYVRAFFIRF